MDPAATSRSIDAVLGQLEELISLERGALTRLDSEALERLAALKASLDQELRARASEVESRHRARLQEIAVSLRKNQMLLVHARDQVLGSLAILGGSSAGACGSHKLPSGAVRLNMRG